MTIKQIIGQCCSAHSFVGLRKKRRTRTQQRSASQPSWLRKNGYKNAHYSSTEDKLPLPRSLGYKKWLQKQPRRQGHLGNGFSPRWEGYENDVSAIGAPCASQSSFTGLRKSQGMGVSIRYPRHVVRTERSAVPSSLPVSRGQARFATDR